VLEPAKKFYPQEQSPIAYVDYRLGFVDDSTWCWATSRATARTPP